MDISHITKLLSSLGANQVTIPILSNEFIETNVDTHYNSIMKNDIYESCDDLIKEIQSKKNETGAQHKKVLSKSKVNSNSTFHNHSRSTPTSVNMENQPSEKHKILYVNILQLFASIKDNLLVFEKNVQKIVNSFLTDLLNFASNNTDLKSIVIEDKKVLKTVVLQELMKLINVDDMSFYKGVSIETMKLLTAISSKFLGKYIVVYNAKAEILYCEFDYNNEDVEDVVIITQDNNHQYSIDEIMKVSDFTKVYVKNSIDEIKQQDNYKENLKSLSVKDLRQIAKRLCIDIVDAHTSKLYSKVDLRLLIEGKLNSI